MMGLTLPWAWKKMEVVFSKPSALPTTSQQRFVQQSLTAGLLRFRHGLVAVLLASVAQFLIAGIERLLGDNSAEFPASILAMAAVFVSFLLSGLVISGLGQFYDKHLRSAADLLNRHMSVGFTIPFIMICRNPLADAHTVGLITACFILTGLVNSISAYFLALPIQSLVVRWDTTWDCSSQEVEIPSTRRIKIWPSSTKSSRDSLFLDFSQRVGEITPRSGYEISERDQPLEDIAQSCATANTDTRDWWASFCGWAFHNPMLLLFWFLTLIVGIPLRAVSGHDKTLSICLLFAIWLTALEIQGTIKATQRLAPWLRTFLFGISNSVLWTSLAMIAYAFMDARISGRAINDTLTSLQTNTPASKIISRLGNDPLPPSMAAGDIALSILNAGLVAWGLKLYEYRSHLLSRAGFTIFLVSSLLSIGNIAVGPLLVHSIGLRPASRDLSFAARSVTIALANPVMAILNGDSGLNATMVVVSGIIYQIGLGFGVGAWLEKRLMCYFGAQPNPACSQPLPEAANSATRATSSNNSTEMTLTGSDQRNLEAQSPEPLSSFLGLAARDVHDPRTVAAGVTIGINSAAMGTAYLYEVKSDAAPYSALSMIALGIMTVGFTAIKPLAAWVMERVADSV